MATTMYNFAGIRRGEPIDVSALSQMSKYITDVNAKLLSGQIHNSSILGAGTTRTHYNTSQVAIWTGIQHIVSNSIPNPNAERVNWSAQFDITFAARPVVTATPFCNTDTGTGPGTVSSSAIWIHEITTTGVKGKWKWLGPATKQKETVYALIIAIGQSKVG